MAQLKSLCLVPALCLATLPLAGCLSSSGGGSSQPDKQNVIVLPKGTKIVCQDGSDPPCPDK